MAKAETLAQEPGVIGKVCQEIKRKDLLHLAILLHDMGKGRKEDHCEVGKAIAEETAARLGCDEQETRTLVFLVHKHLLMSQTAFRRDPYDKKVLLPFARAVETPETLRKLLVLTAADIAAVGPGVLSKWKESLLIELYLRALPEVSGEQDEDGWSGTSQATGERGGARVHGCSGRGARLDRIATGPVSLALSAWDPSEADRGPSGGGRKAAGRGSAGRGELQRGTGHLRVHGDYPR